MDQVSVKSLRSMLIQEEGYRQFPYKDTTGHLTIGIGRNLTANGISKDEAIYMLDNDIKYFADKLVSSLPFFENLSEARKIVLINMCFNLGVNGFMEFKGMIEALENQNYEAASEHILQSKAASQAPNRYKVLAAIMKSGELYV